MVIPLGFQGGLICPVLIGLVRTLTGTLHHSVHVLSDVIMRGAVTCTAGPARRAARPETTLGSPAGGTAMNDYHDNGDRSCEDGHLNPTS
ncbi:hypothetical protein BCAR13_410096 [Paraburkholderia caribensis]|nr:hypothetical protein BCAR13_410096 [Paraburkholderia caribensis]